MAGGELTEERNPLVLAGGESLAKVATSEMGELTTMVQLGEEPVYEALPVPTQPTK